jgi:hypothetical protein
MSLFREHGTHRVDFREPVGDASRVHKGLYRMRLECNPPIPPQIPISDLPLLKP